MSDQPFKILYTTKDYRPKKFVIKQVTEYIPTIAIRPNSIIKSEESLEHLKTLFKNSDFRRSQTIINNTNSQTLRVRNRFSDNS